MNTKDLPLKQLCAVAMQAARDAGEYIQSTDRSLLQRQFKDAGSSAASQLVTEVDFASETIIRDCLRASCEQWDIAFVGEESAQTATENTAERLLKPYHWSVDPLDGTLFFVEGNPGYAVSIALVDQSGNTLIGVVYDPVSASMIYAIKEQGAYRDQMPIRRAASVSTSLVVFADASFSTHEKYSHALNVVNDYAQISGLDRVELINGSGAVKNACRVLEHSDACYFKLAKPEEGGGSIWDFAATACIVAEVGGWVSDIHGKPLALNPNGSTFMNDQGVLYASNERLARYLIEVL